jgi:hypothetical protein
MAAASSWKKVAGIRALGRLPCMKQRAMFAWAALLAAQGGCGGGGGAISPGVADKDAAVATVRQVSFLDGALSKGDPVEILDNVGGLIGGSSLIVIGRPSSAALGALSAPAPGTPPPADAGSASCDGGGCVFAHYRYSGPDGEGEVADGTIAIAAVDPVTRQETLDLTIEDLQSSVGPIHLTASWTLTADSLDGSLHHVFTTPSLDDDLVAFDAIVLDGGSPTGGSLYARWVTAEFGGFDTTVAFP